MFFNCIVLKETRYGRVTVIIGKGWSLIVVFIWRPIGKLKSSDVYRLYFMLKYDLREYRNTSQDVETPSSLYVASVSSWSQPLLLNIKHICFLNSLQHLTLFCSVPPVVCRRTSRELIFNSIQGSVPTYGTLKIAQT